MIEIVPVKISEHFDETRKPLKAPAVCLYLRPNLIYNHLYINNLFSITFYCSPFFVLSHLHKSTRISIKMSVLLLVLGTTPKKSTNKTAETAVLCGV